MQELIWVKQASKQAIPLINGGIADLSYPNSKTRRGRVQGMGEISPTLTATESDICKIDKSNGRYKIRKLTERECLRLMGVDDSDIDKMAEVNSASQLYKQAGNSIVVDVMCAMFRNLNIKGVERWKT